MTPTSLRFSVMAAPTPLPRGGRRAGVGAGSIECRGAANRARRPLLGRETSHHLKREWTRGAGWDTSTSLRGGAGASPLGKRDPLLFAAHFPRDWSTWPRHISGVAAPVTAYPGGLAESSEAG